MPGCAIQKEYTTYYFDYFDTFSTLTVYASTPEEAAEYSRIVDEALAHYDRLYNAHETFDGVVNICTINQSAGQGPVQVSSELYAFLSYCIEAYDISRYTVNVALGPVTALWREQMSADHPVLPDQAALEAAAQLTDIHDVLLDDAAGTVELRYPGMALDAGALAKGYAVGQIQQLLLEAGCKRALLSAGGNVMCIGTPPGLNGWSVGIQNPDTSSEVSLYTTWMAKDQSVVTSGDYERYFEVNGQRYHHIIDPDTLYPGTLYHSVTIGCSDAAISDLLSTALFLLPQDEGLALAEQYDARVLYIP